MLRESGYTAQHQPEEAPAARVTTDSRRFVVGQVKSEARMLLPTRHLSPSALLASILTHFRTPDGRTASHGVARFVRLDGVPDHVTTELTYQLDKNETPEAFSARVWADAQDGDMVEFRLRDGHIATAQIRRYPNMAVVQRAVTEAYHPRPDTPRA